MADAAWVTAWATHDPAGSCRITKLPLEVLIRISKGLSTADLCALRLTCRAIEELLYVTFTSEFFTKKQFMVTDDSLQALVDISRSRLGPHLRCLHIGLDRFPEGLHRPLPDDEKERRFKQRYANHFTLWNTGCHREMLTEAFRNLPGLEDVVLRDYNSIRRNRDGPHAEWTSYGSTTIFKETGIRLSQGASGVWNSGFPLQGCSQVFTLLLHALGVAGATPKGIEVMVRNGNYLRDFAFNVPRFVEPSVRPVLQKLEKLHLAIDLSWRTSPRGWTADQAPVLQAAPDTHLRKLLAGLPNLKNLRINEHHDYNPALTTFLEWLAASPSSGGASHPADDDGEASTAPVEMPHLEELSLGIMNLESATLLAVIQKFAPSLKRLELWRVTLQRDYPAGRDPNDPPKTIFWTDFLDQLRQIPDLNLHHFKAGMLCQAYTHRPKPYYVSFKEHGTTVDYTGPLWKEFVEDVTSKLEVKWPRMVTPEYEASEGEVGSDDEVITVDQDDESIPDELGDQ